MEGGETSASNVSEKGRFMEDLSSGWNGGCGFGTALCRVGYMTLVVSEEICSGRGDSLAAVEFSCGEGVQFLSADVAGNGGKLGELTLIEGGFRGHSVRYSWLLDIIFTGRSLESDFRIDSILKSVGPATRFSGS